MGTFLKRMGTFLRNWWTLGVVAVVGAVIFWFVGESAAQAGISAASGAGTAAIYLAILFVFVIVIAVRESRGGGGED